MTMTPESEIQAKFVTDTGEKRSEILANNFADFRPLISRESGCKKFHEKSSYRTPVKRSSEPQKRFYQTFRIEPPLFRSPFQNFPYLIARLTRSTARAAFEGGCSETTFSKLPNLSDSQNCRGCFSQKNPRAHNKIGTSPLPPNPNTPP